jgi:hypothetical protein
LNDEQVVIGMLLDNIVELAHFITFIQINISKNNLESFKPFGDCCMVNKIVEN